MPTELPRLRKKTAPDRSGLIVCCLPFAALILALGISLFTGSATNDTMLFLQRAIEAMQ